MANVYFDRALLPTGWAEAVRVTVDDGIVAAVVAGAQPAAGEERHRIGLPGMANVHSHAFQRAMAGLTEVRGPISDTFWTWREAMYRFAATMTADDAEAVAAQVYVEMLEAGFTRVGEFHYLHHDRDGRAYANPAEMAERIVAAAAQSEIGLTLLPTFYAHADFGGADPLPGQQRFVCDLPGFARIVEGSRAAIARLAGGKLGVAPHSLRAVTPAELAEVVPLANGGPLHIHVAEQVKEVEACTAWSGARPVAWLLDNCAVDGRWCLIHATHADANEIASMVRAGVVAGLCPVTEANLGDGIFELPRFVAAGGRYGIGTDSNVLIGVADELRQLEYAQRLAQRARNVAAAREGASTGRALFDAAVYGGAQALGLAQAGIAVGAEADFVSLQADHVALAGRTDDMILDSFIFGGAPMVDCVWRRGRKVVSGGMHRDRYAIATRFRAALERLLA